MNSSPKDLCKKLKAWALKWTISFSKWGFHNILEREVLKVLVGIQLRHTLSIFSMSHRTQEATKTSPKTLDQRFLKKSTKRARIGEF
jgi:hypothetical protein